MCPYLRSLGLRDPQSLKAGVECSQKDSGSEWDQEIPETRKMDRTWTRPTVYVSVSILQLVKIRLNPLQLRN